MLYWCRIFAENYTQEISDSVLFMKNHLSKDEPQETLNQPSDPWITVKTNIKGYIVEQLNTINCLDSDILQTPLLIWSIH